MRIGTPLFPGSVKVMLLGAGELGKEVVIELQRLGVEVIASIATPHAPGDAGGAPVPRDRHDRSRRAPRGGRARAAAPARARDRGDRDRRARRARGGRAATVIPTARAARLTMDREGIRRLAAEELGLPTSRYRFADTLDELARRVADARAALRREAGDVLLGQGPVRGPRRRGRCRARLGLRADRRAAPAPVASSSRRFDRTSTTRSRC